MAQGEPYRIAVLGGRGYLGGKVVEACAALPGVEVCAAGRHRRDGCLLIDLADPRTWGHLEIVDAVVDCTDTTAVDPEPFLRRCLELGVVAVEATSDTDALGRLLAVLPAAAERAAGAVIVGAGVFVGLSNMVAARVAERVPGCAHLRVAVRFSPFCRGGRGMVRLMLKMMETPAPAVQGGRAITLSPSTPGPVMPFPDGARPTLTVPFAEPLLLSRSTGVPDIRAGLAASRPTRWALKLTPRWALKVPPLRWLVGAALGVMRRLVLRARDSAVEVSAVATAPGGHRLAEHVRVAHGMDAAAAAIAAMIDQLRGFDAAPRGFFVAEELFDLPLLLERMRLLGQAPTLTTLEATGRTDPGALRPGA